MRWIRIAIAKDEWERDFFGSEVFKIDEAPCGPFKEVRLATDQETGLLARKQLPRPQPNP